MNNEVDNIAIKTAVRPPKVAILLNDKDENWISSCMAIISMFNKMWGGEYNLIIPTDGTNIHEDFIDILKVYDADYICYYESAMVQLKLFDIEKFNEIVSEEITKIKKQVPNFTEEKLGKDRGFLNRIIGTINVEETLENLLSRCTNPFRMGIDDKILTPFRYNEKITYPFTYIGTIMEKVDTHCIEELELNLDCDLTKLLINSKKGILDSNFFEDLKKMGMDLRISEIKSVADINNCLRGVYNIEKIQGNSFALTNIYTSYYTENLYNSNEKSIFIIGNTVSDFCLYYCLSRIKNNVYWIPTLSKYIGDIFYNIDYKIELLQYEENRQGAVLLSHSLRAEEMEVYTKKLTEKNNIRIANNNGYEIKFDLNIKLKDMLRSIKFLYNTDNHSNDAVMLLRNEKTISPIDTPLPKKFKKIRPDIFKWITDVTVDGYLFPKRNYLANKLLINKNYSHREIRITKSGLSYFCPHTSYFNAWGEDINNFKVKPYLEVLTPYKIFKEIFSQVGKYIKYSDKGFYESEFIKKIGSIDKVERILNDENYKALFDKFIDTSRNEANKYDNGVYLNKRRYLDYSSICSLLNNDKKAVNIIDDLIKKGIILRGFVFKCAYCRNADWYSISEVNEVFQCKRCSTEQAYTFENLRLQPPQLRTEPIWYYKMEELSYQAYFHNSIVPLLTISALKKSAQKSFQYISEIEIRSCEDSERPNMEVDVCCIIDGLVVIGECKIGDKLGEGSETDEIVINKYYQLAEQIQADILVFSSYKNWKQSTKDKITELKNRSKRCKILIIENEILTGMKELEI